MKRGADLVVDALIEAGIERLYSLSGNQIMPIYDACVGRDIEIVHVRHEAAAVYMAEAEAQLTGRTGVALVTAGPGFANATGPLFSAQSSESPVLLLSGDSPIGQDGKGAFQELDQIALSSPVTKMAIRCTSFNEIKTDMSRLLDLSRFGRPGPVHMSIPFNILNEQSGENPLHSSHNLIQEKVTDTEFARISDAVIKAERPLLVFGPQGNRASNKSILEQLISLADIPFFVMESPRGLNDPSLGAIRRKLIEADLVVCCGKRVDFQLEFGNLPGNQTWIIVDWEQSVIDQAKRNLGKAISHVLLKDPFLFVTELIGSLRISNSKPSYWFESVQSSIAERSVSTLVDEEGKILPSQICHIVQQVASDLPNSIIVADGGEFGQWAQACLSSSQRLINGPAGAIGGGLCYGIAAAMANPRSRVFSLMGDGTAGFHFMEFETAVRHNVSLVVIVGNDQRWNAEHQIQVRDYGVNRVYATGLGNARYDLAAKALGGHGEHVVRLGDLENSLIRAITSGLPACINIEMKGIPAPIII